MNPPFEELIHGWSEGIDSEEQLRQLTDALASKESRAALRAEWFLDAGLAEALRTASVVKLVDFQTEEERKTFAQTRKGILARSWVPLAAAACLGLLLISWPRRPAAPARDFSAVFASSEEAISRFSYQPSTTLPAWISPTASMLDQPHFSH